jgi:hypothetical protein
MTYSKVMSLVQNKTFMEENKIQYRNVLKEPCITVELVT